tara:strand:- start:467 stop:670 length:204 start_codon:yes stop_codon:yes gene_type:complete
MIELQNFAITIGSKLQKQELLIQHQNDLIQQHILKQEESKNNESKLINQLKEEIKDDNKDMRQFVIN